MLPMIVILYGLKARRVHIAVARVLKKRVDISNRVPKVS